MQAHNGSTQKHSPSGNNNQPGGRGTSQTSDNVARNQSPLTGCCCKPARAPVGVVPTGPSYHMPACQSCGTAFGKSVPPAYCTGHGKRHFWMLKVAQSSSTRADVKLAPLSLSSFVGTPKTTMKCS